MINSYLQYIQEGYLFSDKTISVNLDKFESGENKKLPNANIKEYKVPKL